MSSTYILKLPHIKIQNANALSSPYTIGFPAMTAWLGFMHALERKLRADTTWILCLILLLLLVTGVIYKPIAVE